MNVPIEYILYACMEAKGANKMKIKEFFNFLCILRREYRVVLFDSFEEAQRQLEILKSIGLIDIQGEGPDSEIVLKDAELIDKYAKIVEGSYIARIDRMYRETLDRIKEAAREFFKKTEI